MTCRCYLGLVVFYRLWALLHRIATVPPFLQNGRPGVAFSDFRVAGISGPPQHRTDRRMAYGPRYGGRQSDIPSCCMRRRRPSAAPLPRPAALPDRWVDVAFACRPPACYLTPTYLLPTPPPGRLVVPYRCTVEQRCVLSWRLISRGDVAA